MIAFADLPPPAASELLTWLLVASFIGNLILLVQKLRGGSEPRSISPDPLNVRAHPEFVPRADYHKHAELNRAEHTRIESKAEVGMTAVAHQLNTLSREVTEGNARSEMNENRLKEIADQLTEVARTVNELAGAFHQLAKTTGGKR